VATALQPLQPPASSKRTERVLKVPPIEITEELADAVVGELHELAETRANQELEQARINDAQIRAIEQIPSYERYTFLSPTSNVQFHRMDFQVKDLPKDLDLIAARADGPNGRFIDLRVQTKFRDFNEVRNWQLNQIIIQGDDPDWVNAVYEKLRGLIDPQRFRTRSFVYGNCLKLFWLSAILLLFAEYRVARWLYPNFTLGAPLSGTGALVMFGILTASLLIFANTMIALYVYWFPYFEVEGNLSRSRTASRKMCTTLLSAIYAAAIVNVLAFLFGPVLARLIGSK